MKVKLNMENGESSQESLESPSLIQKEKPIQQKNPIIAPRSQRNKAWPATVVFLGLLVSNVIGVAMIKEGTIGFVQVHPGDIIVKKPGFSRPSNRDFPWLQQTKINAEQTSAVYFEIFQTILAKQPNRVRDLMVCFLKAFTYSQTPVMQNLELFLLEIVVNSKAVYKNQPADLEPLPECRLSETFRDAFASRYPDVDLEGLLDRGEHTLQLVGRLILQTDSHIRRASLKHDSLLPLKRLLVYITALTTETISDEVLARLFPEDTLPVDHHTKSAIMKSRRPIDDQNLPPAKKTDLADMADTIFGGELLRPEQHLSKLIQSGYWNGCFSKHSDLDSVNLHRINGKSISLLELSSHWTYPFGLSWKIDDYLRPETLDDNTSSSDAHQRLLETLQASKTQESKNKQQLDAKSLQQEMEEIFKPDNIETVKAPDLEITHLAPFSRQGTRQSTQSRARHRLFIPHHSCDKEPQSCMISVKTLANLVKHYATVSESNLSLDSSCSSASWTSEADNQQEHTSERTAKGKRRKRQKNHQEARRKEHSSRKGKGLSRAAEPRRPRSLRRAAPERWCNRPGRGPRRTTAGSRRCSIGRNK